MKKVFLLIIIGGLISFPVFASSDNNLRSKFREIRKNSVWPVQGSSFDDIISPFGPRWLGRYDWHYGTDIVADKGAKVLAPKKGELYSFENYGGGGKTVILQHEFPRGAKYLGEDLQYYYTFYLHLDKTTKKIRQASKKDKAINIKKGQVIGYVGETGNAGSPHLHLELSVGEVWSQQYNNAGYDPNFNAMMLFKPQKKNMTLEKQDNKVKIYLPDDQTILNKVKFVIKDKNKRGNNIVKQHVLNLNRRVGFDASSIDTLDTPDTTKPYFNVENCGFTSDNFYTEIAIPKKYTKKYLGNNYQRILTVYDVWGRSKQIML